MYSVIWTTFDYRVGMQKRWFATECAARKFAALKQIAVVYSPAGEVLR